MGSRGGGRGRGRFGNGGFRYAKQEPFELFPEIELPAINKDEVQKSVGLAKICARLQRYSKDLPYYLEETLEDDNVDIERYSDMGKKRSLSNRVSLENSGYLTLQPGYFPLELLRGTKRRTGKKVQWNPKRDLKKLDLLEHLEAKFTDIDSEGKTGKKGEEEEDEEVEEVEDFSSDDSDDDYNKLHDIDDDDDPYNQLSEDEEDIL